MKYNGQPGRQFYTRFNEHMCSCARKRKKSTYAQHLLDKGCVMDPNVNIMQILHIMKTGNHMNTLEKLCIYKESNRNNQVNDGSITTENKIFYTIIRYGTPYTVPESPYSTYKNPIQCRHIQIAIHTLPPPLHELQSMSTQ